MPTTKTITLYTLDELSPEAQEKAMRHLWNINVDQDWWEHIYADAKRIGLLITSFDLDHQCIGGNLTMDSLECCRLIRANHGKNCETFKTARDYLRKYGKALGEYRKWLLNRDAVREYYETWGPADWRDDFEQDDIALELVEDFRKMLLEDYLSILRSEYDYQTGEEAVRDSIVANEYTFTEDGERA